MELGSITAVGVWFLAESTGRYFYLLRNDLKNPGTWGLPGGKVEDGESLLSAINRECCEELGFLPKFQKIIPLEKFTSPDGRFVYHTFFSIVPEEFAPTLNDEHLGYAWVAADSIPKPLHPGFWSTINVETVQEKIKMLQSTILSK